MSLSDPPQGSSGKPAGQTEAADDSDATRIILVQPKPIGSDAAPPRSSQGAPRDDRSHFDADATQIFPETMIGGLAAHDAAKPPTSTKRFDTPLTSDGSSVDTDGEATQIFPATFISAAHAPADATQVMPASALPGSNHPSAGPTNLPDSPQVTGAAVAPLLRTSAGTMPGTTLPRSAGNADEPLRQVGRYEIRRRLGRGGMATVYLAHDPKIGRDVALKFLHASLSEDDECRTRFVREARAAGGLSHPHIVTVHDVGEIDGRPFMAMELLEGESLAELLEAKQVLPIRDVVSLGIELAGALEYAHARGVVHRDIKPGNIMMLPDHRGIKVTDFGIAHVEQAGMQQQTLVGAVLGTPQYMSPEQARGEKLDGRSDLFSVGIVLYQALTGGRPFKGENMVAFAQNIATAEPAPISSRRPDTPAVLRRVVEKCLAKQPDQRFATGADLARALRRVAGELDAAAAEKQKQRIVPLRVKWALMMAGIVAVVMGLTAAAITQRQYSALLAQASDYGAGFTLFIGQQNAASMLSEEWEVVDVAVQETMRTRNFERITVIDKGGTVRASTMAALVGKPYQPPGGPTPTGTLSGNVLASRYEAPAGPVLGFEAPVMFRDQLVGRVMLGVPEQPLAQVARLSITLMAVLAVVTVLAVGLAMYFVANWFAQPIKLVVEAIGELTRGHYGHRIAEVRKDEFGELYNAVDQLGAALQRRADPERGTLPSTLTSLNLNTTGISGTAASHSGAKTPPPAPPKA